MYSLKIVVESGGREALKQFNAGLYFSILRAAGGNPHITENGLFTVISPATKAMREAGQWAALHDPTGHIRLAFAQAAWERRPRGATFVMLGMSTGR